ncbi:MAG: hypothetical protein KC910_25770 [Candidatus Eremiobacteraeota bacterium]|nr:hypothetical protein [Candidatus Eremiobacteraeota bacterium]
MNTLRSLFSMALAIALLVGCSQPTPTPGPVTTPVATPAVAEGHLTIAPFTLTLAGPEGDAEHTLRISGDDQGQVTIKSIAQEKHFKVFSDGRMETDGQRQSVKLNAQGEVELDGQPGPMRVESNGDLMVGDVLRWQRVGDTYSAVDPALAKQGTVTVEAGPEANRLVGYVLALYFTISEPAFDTEDAVELTPTPQ